MINSSLILRALEDPEVSGVPEEVLLQAGVPFGALEDWRVRNTGLLIAGYRPCCPCGHLMARGTKVCGVEYRPAGGFRVDLACEECGEVVGRGGMFSVSLAGETFPCLPMDFRGGRTLWSDKKAI